MTWPSYGNAYSGATLTASFVADAHTWTTTSGNKQASITPAAGELLVVACGASGISAPTSLTDNRGGTYYQAVLALRTTSGYVALYVREQLVTSVASHTVTLAQSGDTGGGLSVQRWSGFVLAGQNAVRQTASASAQASGTTPTLTFASALLTGNPSISSVSMTGNTGSVTAPTGWTRQEFVGYASPTTSLEVSTRDSGSTASAITYGSTANQSYGAVALELTATFNYTQNHTVANLTLGAGTHTAAKAVSTHHAVANLSLGAGTHIQLFGAAGATSSVYGTAKYGTDKYGKPSFQTAHTAAALSLGAGTHNHVVTRVANVNYTQQHTKANLTLVGGSHTQTFVNFHPIPDPNPDPQPGPSSESHGTLTRVNDGLRLRQLKKLRKHFGLSQ